MEAFNSIWGARRAAILYSLIVTAKMNDVDPQARLADVLARLARHSAHHIAASLPLTKAGSGYGLLPSPMATQ